MYFRKYCIMEWVKSWSLEEAKCILWQNITQNPTPTFKIHSRVLFVLGSLVLLYSCDFINFLISPPPPLTYTFVMLLLINERHTIKDNSHGAWLSEVGEIGHTNSTVKCELVWKQWKADRQIKLKSHWSLIWVLSEPRQYSGQTVIRFNITSACYPP